MKYKYLVVGVQTEKWTYGVDLRYWVRLATAKRSLNGIKYPYPFNLFI